MKKLRLACVMALAPFALGVTPGVTPGAPTAPVVRDLAVAPPDVALLHSGRQSAGIHPVYFGKEIAQGDFNADGKTDIAVSAEYSSIGGDRSPGRGRVFVYFGKGSDFPAQIEPAELGADCSIEGPETFAYFGTNLVAGDFDGDGRDDLAITSMKLGDVYKGHVYVVWGLAIANSAEVRMDAGSYGSHIEGRSNRIGGFYSYFGFSLAAGDFNGDGIDDLAAGAFGASGPGDALRESGEVSIFLGRRAWFRELVASEGTADMLIYGGKRGYSFGSELAAGDLNGDGRAELVVAAWAGAGPAGGRSYAGDVSVFDFSSKSGVKLPRKPGKKRKTWNVAQTAPSAMIYGPEFNTRIGSSSSDGGGRSLAVGDFDDDGWNDVIVGSGFSGQPSPLKNPGKAWIVWGAESLTKGASIDLASPGPAASVLAEGTGSDTLGDAVTVGDVDGDGQTDVVLGAPDADNARGYAAVYLGRPRPVAGAPIASEPNAVVVGRRALWRAGEDVIILDETFAGRRLVGLGTSHGGYVRYDIPRGYAGQLDMVDAASLVQ